MAITCSPSNRSSRVRKSAALESPGFNTTGLGDLGLGVNAADRGVEVQLTSATATRITIALKAPPS
jgi:hypothetical protein